MGMAVDMLVLQYRHFGSCKVYKFRDQQYKYRAETDGKRQTIEFLEYHFAYGDFFLYLSGSGLSD